MKIVINQPYFLPYIGLFEKVKAADLFIINDLSRISRCAVSHRRVKVICGVKSRTTKYLTQLVYAKDENKKFKDIKMDKYFYCRAKEMVNSLQLTYGRAKYFKYLGPELFKLLLDEKPKNLADYNIRLIRLLMNKLKIKTKIIVASRSKLFNDLENNYDGSKYLNYGTYTTYSMVKRMKGDYYISGASSYRFLDDNIFVKNGIKILQHTLDLKPYPQFYYKNKEFIKGLSVVDLIFNNGKFSKNYIQTKTLREKNEI